MNISPIANNNYNYYNRLPAQTRPNLAFKGARPIETIKHYNLGMMRDGIIGKIRVLNNAGEDAYLNVVKITGASKQETYKVQDSIGRQFGEIDIEFRDKNPINGEEPHVFVQLVRNYSDPNTEFYKPGLKEHKQIGTRLIQIAQRRSDEASCQGNIKLHAKNDRTDWYKYLGFEPESAQMCGYEGNKTRMYLPAWAKERLSQLSSGL